MEFIFFSLLMNVYYDCFQSKINTEILAVIGTQINFECPPGYILKDLKNKESKVQQSIIIEIRSPVPVNVPCECLNKEKGKECEIVFKISPFRQVQTWGMATIVREREAIVIDFSGEANDYDRTDWIIENNLLLNSLNGRHAIQHGKLYIYQVGCEYLGELMLRVYNQNKTKILKIVNLVPHYVLSIFGLNARKYIVTITFRWTSTYNVDKAENYKPFMSPLIDENMLSYTLYRNIRDSVESMPFVFKCAARSFDGQDQKEIAIKFEVPLEETF